MDVRIIALTIAVELILFGIGVCLEVYDEYRMTHFDD